MQIFGRRCAGVFPYNINFGLAAGLDDRCVTEPCKPTPLQPDTLIPAGSSTKSWTAVAILQQAELGRLRLDSPAHLYADPVLQVRNSALTTS